LLAAWRFRENQKGKATDRRTRRHVARFILVALYTGTRAGAVCAAALEPTEGRGWIDLERGIFYRRPQGERKTKKRRPPVPLPNRLLAHLRRWHRLGQRSPVEWNRRPVKDVDKAFRHVANAAGLADVTPHILRHTAATWLMQLRTDKWEAAEYLGMTAEQLDKTYGHHHPDFQHDAAAAVTGLLRQKRDRNAVNKARRTSPNPGNRRPAPLAGQPVETPTRHEMRQAFLATGKSYAGVLVCYGGAAEVTGREKSVDAMLTFAAERAGPRAARMPATRPAPMRAWPNRRRPRVRLRRMNLAISLRKRGRNLRQPASRAGLRNSDHGFVVFRDLRRPFTSDTFVASELLVLEASYAFPNFVVNRCSVAAIYPGSVFQQTYRQYGRRPERVVLKHGGKQRRRDVKFSRIDETGGGSVSGSGGNHAYRAAWPVGGIENQHA
jgi:hypothetical protein